MRRLPVAILVSVTSHAVALGWLVWSGSVLAVPLREPAPSMIAPTPARAPAAASTEEITLVLLDARATAAASSPPAFAAAAHAAPTATGAERPAASLVIETGARSVAPASRGDASGTAPGEPGATEHGTPGRSPWMTMRREERPALGLSQKFVDDFLARSKPVPPPPDIPDERLADEIAEERRKLRAGHGSIQRIVELNEQRANEELKPAGGGSFLADKRTFTAKVAPDGSAQLEDKRTQLDTQDSIMLRMGIDPYGRNKLALLDRTRDQRVALGERHRRVQMAHAAEVALRNVERLWATTPGLAERKRGLFELWDDCAETGSDEIIAAGADARRIVIGAIRGRLRGPDAYTAAELAALNATRRSQAVFAPYE